MKATITIEYSIDGDPPSNDAIRNALLSIIADSAYIGSEQVDGTDNWGIEVDGVEIEVEEGSD